MTRRPVCPIGPELFGILVTLEVWMWPALHKSRYWGKTLPQRFQVVAPAVGDIAVYCPRSVFLSGLLHFQPGFVTWTDIELPAELHADKSAWAVCAFAPCLPIGSRSSGLAHYWFIEPVQEPYHDSQDWSLAENNRGRQAAYMGHEGWKGPFSSQQLLGIYSLQLQVRKRNLLQYANRQYGLAPPNKWSAINRGQSNQYFGAPHPKGLLRSNIMYDSRIWSMQIFCWLFFSDQYFAMILKATSFVQ